MALSRAQPERGPDAEGKTADLEARAGQVIWRPESKHIVENVGTTATEGVLVEFKTKAPKAAPKPAAAKK